MTKTRGVGDRRELGFEDWETVARLLVLVAGCLAHAAASAAAAATPANAACWNCAGCPQARVPCGERELLPCEGCSVPMYCSRACRSEAPVLKSSFCIAFIQ
jgi:hypothetical protein